MRKEILSVFFGLILLSCNPETCSDGIQNQDETDVDCGGVICNACPIIYPETGVYGTNILNATDNNFNALGTADIDTYSFRCVLPASSSIKIVVKANYDITTSNENYGWGSQVGTANGWFMSATNFTADSQEFFSDEADLSARIIDMKWLFWENTAGPTGSAVIEFYENGASQVTFSKTVNW